MKISGMVILLICFSACTAPENQTKAPAGLLAMDTMALLLRDIHDLESGLMVTGVRQDSAQVLYRILETQLFQKYRLDTGKVNRSLRYYSSNPVLLDSLYHLVLHKTDSTASFQP